MSASDAGIIPAGRLAQECRHSSAGYVRRPDMTQRTRIISARISTPYPARSAGGASPGRRRTRPPGGAAGGSLTLGFLTMHIDTIFNAVGRFAVRFRWLVLLIWIVWAIVAVTQLPSLSSVTQSNNSKFLPASAPSERAAVLAAPFGTANLLPIPVVAARSGSSLTAADVTALTTLQGRLRSVSSVVKVLDAGRSPDGRAEQLVVLATQGGGNQNQQTALIDGLRAKISSAGLPAGLHAHLAGAVATQVDQQKASGNTATLLLLVRK